MRFPFPSNPVDGQVVTHTQADGTVLSATYIAAKNEWYVERKLPNPPSINLQSGTPYVVPPAVRDGQVLTWDNTANQWVPKTPAAASGGSGGTFIKANQAAPDTTDPPDPLKPLETLKAGMLQTTPENLHHELKYWDGTNWQNLFSEEEIKQWISAGSLFRGVIKETSLSSLPAVALANRGFYWSWTGAPGHVVSAADPGIGTTVTGSFTGNSSADGPFVYTGCLPGRIQYGSVDVLYQDRLSQSNVDFLACGFKVRSTTSNSGTVAWTVTTTHSGGEFNGNKVPYGGADNSPAPAVFN